MSSPVIIGDATLYLADCLDAMAAMDAESIDAIVTDPPYGLSFMGRDWDHGVPGVHFWQEALRVAKPGAHMLAFGGTRTFHRLTCAIEDAGWEIRDCIMWVYGSGFPKSHDVSKGIDKAAGAVRDVVERIPDRWAGKGQVLQRSTQDERGEAHITAPASDAAIEWDGWGTALKPAWEPIIVARKPLAGTVADNVQRFGTGAINVDACRVDGAPRTTHADGNWKGECKEGWGFKADHFTEQPSGRWPANLIHDGSAEVVALFPADVGAFAAPTLNGGRTTVQTFGEFAARSDVFHADTGSAARFFYCAKASREDRNEGCEGLERRPLNWSSGDQSPGTFQAEGTDRTSPNNHPTVKPTDLMRYLCRLVTPPDGLILDPFAGSGSTGKAAILEGFRFVGIDTESEYIEIARRRIAEAQARPKQQRMFA